MRKVCKIAVQISIYHKPIAKRKEGFMPLVEIHYKASVGEEVLKHVIKALPFVTASALSVASQPDGDLTAQDIEVVPIQLHPLAICDKDMMVVIFAHEYKERAENLTKRTETIFSVMDEVVPKDITFFVWIFLGETAFKTRSVIRA